MLERHDITRLYDRHAHVMLGFFARRTFDPDAAVRISAALVKAIAEAKAMVDAEKFGPELRDVLGVFAKRSVSTTAVDGEFNRSTQQPDEIVELVIRIAGSSSAVR